MTTSFFLPLLHKAIHCSGIGSCDVSHSISFCPDIITCKVLCCEPWVWIKVSCFCYTINTGRSLRFLSVTLWLTKLCRSCSCGSTWPIPLQSPAGHNWVGFGGGPPQNPRCKLVWQLDWQAQTSTMTPSPYPSGGTGPAPLGQ